MPIYHQQLAHQLSKPIAVLNIGGIANVTFLNGSEEGILAFDTGPGNALIDDWVQRHGHGAFDDGGVHAARGTVSHERVARAAAASYMSLHPPKSLDRGDFTLDLVEVPLLF